ncbi:hypothetical protein RND71_010165 [Anisodus tanguticus]|uniref:40S ribosomal protein S18 n=1 Tax=Anisodus tanguticus TaxID=243964 RepID=A0AAE1VSG5_9SOLA|nr:hypothetical protein RND71_010165 [Anisodus tanguticus]
MAFLLNKIALSKLRFNHQKTDESLMLSRRGIHIEPGAREKAFLAADPSLKRFKSHKQSVRTLKRVGDVLTIVVVAGETVRQALGSASLHQLTKQPHPRAGFETLTMLLVANEDFQHILRVQNTNVDGKQKIMFAMTSIKGIGRRFANIACKKADIDMSKRAGELSADEIDSLMTIVANPRQFKIPDWFLNRQKDYKDGKFSQVTSNALDMKLRDDLERLKKIRLAQENELGLLPRGLPQLKWGPARGCTNRRAVTCGSINRENSGGQPAGIQTGVGKGGISNPKILGDQPAGNQTVVGTSRNLCRDSFGGQPAGAQTGIGKGRTSTKGKLGGELFNIGICSISPGVKQSVIFRALFDQPCS